MKNINTFKTFLFTFSLLGTLLVSSHGSKDSSTAEKEMATDLSKAIFKPAENNTMEKQTFLNISETKSEALSNSEGDFDHRGDDKKDTIKDLNLSIADNKDEFQSLFSSDPLKKAIVQFGENSHYEKKSLDILSTKSLDENNKSRGDSFNGSNLEGSHVDFLPNIPKTFSHDGFSQNGGHNSAFDNQREKPLNEGVMGSANGHSLFKGVAIPLTESFEDNGKNSLNKGVMDSLSNYPSFFKNLPLVESAEDNGKNSLNKGVVGSANDHPFVKNIAISATESIVEGK